MKEEYIKTLSSKDLSQYSSDIQKGEYHIAEISKIGNIEHFLNIN